MNEAHKKGYTFLKYTVGLTFLLYYRPKRINKKIIPKEGPVILASNHIHLFDQNIACMSTKRMLHYMSKMEHLTGKFGWFFKMAGCIGVNRSVRDEEAKEKAISILKQSKMLGIFPEGTRNQVSGKKEYADKIYELYKDKYSYKELIKILKKNMVRVSEVNLLDILEKEGRINHTDYILNVINPEKYILSLYEQNKISYKEYTESFFLPFKFGIVSMAQKTGAVIIPSVITGKYKFFSNHLSSRFGKPMSINENDDLEVKLKELRDEMIKLMLEGKEDIKKGLY